MMSDIQKRTWAEINLDNIVHNYRAIKDRLPEGCRYLGVVKANAYGHGANAVAHTLEKAGADYLAVACLDEAVALRRDGILLPILILGHTPAEYVPELIANNITQAVTNEETAAAFNEEAKKVGKKLKVHIKVDTGMSRLGFQCAGDLFESGTQAIIRSCKLGCLDVEGIFTHFAVSDDPGLESSVAYTKAQHDLFLNVIKTCEDAGIHFEIRHCANTGASVNYLDPEYALDMVRPGISLYGYGDNGKYGLKPVMSLKTKVLTVKEYEPGTTISYGRLYKVEKPTRIGVLGIGYADGLFRALSNKASFLTEEGLAPQRGRICMDMCMIDLTGKDNVKEGSVVEIFGENCDIMPLCDILDTITYELVCAVSQRVPREYIYTKTKY